MLVMGGVMIVVSVVLWVAVGIQVGLQDSKLRQLSLQLSKYTSLLLRVARIGGCMIAGGKHKYY